ncbi:hypothetical protein yaldo0001_34390 [Yersinia aldovae ATCC 35236]|nr:hypothetical protein yaldo0001_34390 [Yersinia aldovae ATCC 35236]
MQPSHHGNSLDGKQQKTDDYRILRLTRDTIIKFATRHICPYLALPSLNEL